MALVEAKQANIVGFFLKEFDGKQIRTREKDRYVNSTDIYKSKKGKRTNDYFEAPRLRNSFLRFLLLRDSPQLNYWKKEGRG
jgi:hypothetical protein